MKAAEALAVLAARSDENRKAITAAAAIEPLVGSSATAGRAHRHAGARGGGARRPRARRREQEEDRRGGRRRAARRDALVDSHEAQTHAAAALWQIAALGNNRPRSPTRARLPLVMLLAGDPEQPLTNLTHKFATGALFHLSSSADNKVAMVQAGAIPLLVGILQSKSADAREHAAAVVSSLARTQGRTRRPSTRRARSSRSSSCSMTRSRRRAATRRARCGASLTGRTASTTSTSRRRARSSR